MDESLRALGGLCVCRLIAFPLVWCKEVSDAAEWYITSSVKDMYSYVSLVKSEV